MKQISPALKSWAEFVEKALLIITLVIGLGMSAYKGIQFLSAKKSQVIAETKEVEKRIGILDALTETYLSQLKIINEDIRKLDEEMKEGVWKDSIGWEKRIVLRVEKMKDRQVLLEQMGSQMLRLKEMEAK